MSKLRMGYQSISVLYNQVYPIQCFRKQTLVISS